MNAKTNLMMQEYKNTIEFNRLVKFFEKKPHLFVDKSCIFTGNATMDGIDYVIGTPNGIVSGSVKYAEMGGLTARKFLPKVYEKLVADTPCEKNKKK